MLLDEIKSLIPEFAKDTRLNLSTLLSDNGAPGLSKKQIFGVALSCAYALSDEKLIGFLLQNSKDVVGDEVVFGAKSAANIMAMNNVYYRFVHLAENDSLSKMPARLRMNVIAKPGVEKVDFELYSLAVSALSGCQSCIQSHIRAAQNGGINQDGIQSTARLASVINAAHHAIQTERITP